MNSLIITNTHILFGEWSSIKDKYTLNDLKYIALSKPIKEVLKSQNSIRTVLKEALDKFSTKDNQVAIVIDDELLYHDKFASEESLTKREIWDYIQWETKQKWGELGNYYTTFAETDSPNPNALHSITCPAFLVTEIKALISNQGGKPIWAGPLSTIYLENSKYRNAIYMTDDDSFIQFFYRGRDGYSEGKVRFIGGQPSVTVILGDKVEQDSLFKIPNDARDFVSIDLISDAKNTYLRQYRYKRVVPFEGIDVKIDDVPEEISFKLLNGLSIMMADFSFESLVNFFNPSQIQNKKYEDMGKLSFNSERERVDGKVSPDKGEPPTKRKIKKEKTKKSNKKRVLLPFLIIILLGLIGYYMFFTGNGKDLSEMTKNIGVTKSMDMIDSNIFFDQQFNQSASIINMYSLLTSVVSPDSFISVNLVDASGSIEFVGTDSIAIPNIEFLHYEVDSIDCCGGIKQNADFNIIALPDIKSNIWLNLPDIINHIESSLKIHKIRQLDMITENGANYSPIIFEANSLSQIDNTIQYLKFAGDNIIVRKIDITNSPITNNFSGKFYIAVFEPL